MAASARNKIDANSGLGGNIEDDRLAVVDDESAIENDRLAINNDIRLATRIDNKTDVDNGLDAQASNQANVRPSIKEDAGAVNSIDNSFDSGSGNKPDADLIIDNVR